MTTNIEWDWPLPEAPKRTVKYTPAYRWVDEVTVSYPRTLPGDAWDQNRRKPMTKEEAEDFIAQAREAWANSAKGFFVEEYEG